MPAGQGTHTLAALYVPWVQLTLGVGLAVDVGDGVGGGEGLAPMERLAAGDTERVAVGVIVPLGDCEGVGDGDLHSGPLIGPDMPLFAEKPETLT